MDKSTLVDNLSTEIDALTMQRDSAAKQAKAIIAQIRADGRNEATPQEDARIDAAIATRNAKDAEIRALEAKLNDAQRALDMERAVRGEAFVPAQRKYDDVARVGQETRTYNPASDKRGNQFLRDVGLQAVFGDLEAGQRLQRHMAEERVERADYLQKRTVTGSGTGNFQGLVVPQYLTDLYAPAVAAMRPFADACHHVDLPPEGMTVNISRITTPSLVDAQSAENAAVDGQDMDDTLLTIPVKTASGQALLSRQALDRGTGIEAVLLDDLFRRYGSFIDYSLINDASHGLTTIATANTLSASTALTAQGFYSKILGAASGVEKALLGFGRANLAIMSSDRWGWYQAQAVSTWPAVQQPNYDPRTFGSANAVGYGNPTVVNKWDSNWAKGTPSVGLMQVIGPTFRGNAGQFLNTGPFEYGVSVDPLANIFAGLHYAIGRYGSLSALNRPGGYAHGGLVMPTALTAPKGADVHRSYMVPGMASGGTVNGMPSGNTNYTLNIHNAGNNNVDLQSQYRRMEILANI